MGLFGGAFERGLRGYFVVGLVFALIVAACGGSGSAGDTTTSAPASAAITTIAVGPSSAESTPSGASTTSIASAATAPSATCTPTASQPVAVSDWGNFGFDDANSRHNRAETRVGPGNVSCLEILWRIDDLGGVTGTPVVVDGVVYFGDWNGGLHAVEAETGAVIWEEQFSREKDLGGITVDVAPVFAATALVTGRRVFVPDLDGFLYARDRDSGSAVWATEVDDQPAAAIFSAPVLVDGMIIVAVGGNDSFDSSLRGSVVAVDADTGDVLWRLPMADEDSGVRTGIWTSAAVDRALGLVFFGTGDSMGLPAPLANALVAIDYETGELVWHTMLSLDDQIEADVGASPNLFTIDGRDVVGVGGKNGLFKVVDRQTGAEVWSVQLTEGKEGFTFTSGVQSTAALGDGVIYVSSHTVDLDDAITFALDMNDGSILWERLLPDAVFGSMTLANGVVFHGTAGGTIYALDASDGNVLWSDRLPGNFGDGISVANGRLYVGYGFGASFQAARDGGIVVYTLP
jgi:polyvinyl alcohol dehydrogenase (cytochrome)